MVYITLILWVFRLWHTLGKLNSFTIWPKAFLYYFIASSFFAMANIAISFTPPRENNVHRRKKGHGEGRFRPLKRLTFS